MNKNKKILFFINSLHFGGAESQVIQDGKILSDLGHTVTIAVIEIGPLIKQVKYPISIIIIKNKTILGIIYELTKILIKGNYDLVFSHLFKSNILCLIACFLTHTKFIAFEHGLGTWKKWYHKVLCKLISLGSQYIITCSYASREARIVNEYISASKIIVIHNSYNGKYENFKINKKDLFTIGYTGRFVKIKQLYTFIELAKIFKNKNIYDFRIILVGDGPEMITLKKKIVEHNLKDFFEFPGFVKNTSIYLKQFDVFVLPSASEDFSLALLEAGAHGIPAIAYDVGGNKEIISDGITGFLIPPFDIEKLFIRLLELKYNPEKLNLMGTRAVNHISRFFDIKIRQDKLNKLIQK